MNLDEASHLIDHSPDYEDGRTVILELIARINALEQDVYFLSKDLDQLKGKRP